MRCTAELDYIYRFNTIRAEKAQVRSPKEVYLKITWILMIK